MRGMTMSKQKRDSFKIIKLVLIGLIIGFLSPILFRFINLPTDFLKLTIEQATFIQLGAVLIIYIPTIICIRKANQHFNRIDETVDDENDWHSKKGSKRLFQARLRSEEHTSELQSRGQLVCRLLLEKKKSKHE